MKRPISFAVALTVLALAAAGGCDRDKKNNQQAGGPATQPAAGAAAAKYEVPRVGIPYTPREQYKPAVGKRGGRIVLDSLGEPKSFNPISSGETSTSDYTDRIFEGLTTMDVWTGEVKPHVAESWDVSTDGLVWTFKLRKDVKFNDGTPLTAEDVVFTWNDGVYDLSRPPGTEPRWPCSMRDIATFDGKIVKVEAVDTYTVRFTVPVKMAIWDQVVGDPMILSKKKYAPMVANGTFNGAMSADSRPEDIVGTGPFMLGEYRRGEQITLNRNPHYWKKDAAGQSLPYLDEVVFRILRTLDQMMLNFQQGVTDVYALKSGKDVPELKPRMSEGNFELYQIGPAFGAEFICLNMNEDAARNGKIQPYKVKWFRDTRFRRAIAHAIDRPSIIRNVQRGLAHPLAAHYTVNPGPFFYPEFEPYEYNPDKSKALLREMGLYDRNGDGFIEDEQGNKVSFTINTNAGNSIREEIAHFTRTDLSKLGMEVNVLFLEFNLLVDKIDNTFDWECMVFGLTGSQDPHWGANVWKSDGRLHMWWPFQKTPSFPWEKRIDEVFSTGIQELDKAKRKALYREFVKIIYEEQPYIYTTTPERVVAVRKRFGNMFPAPAPRYAATHNLEEVFVK
jgi:peptide/nickel transport system substrate-binding protein